MQVVVVGGGVIGAATAHYLAQKGARPVVLEAVGPACSASGKAGGFLALEWCDSNAVGPLARRSYALHAQLAEELGEDCGYRKCTTHSVAVKAGGGGGGGGAKRFRLDGLPAWVDTSSISQSSVIGSEATTAQVHPELLTKALLRSAEKRGGSLRLAAVTGVDASGGRLAAVTLRDAASGQEERLEADAFVFAMGAWTPQLAAWLPQAQLPDVSGLKVHSIVLQDNAGTTADALFLAYRGTDGKSLEPEVYPRPNSTVYVCGVSDEGVPVPATAADVLPRPEAIAALRGVAASVSQELGRAELLQQQACYLPCTDDGLPLIGRIPGLSNGYIATGHSCWGILNAPATGEALAELVVDGKASSSSLAAFDPARLARR